jgi:hypothetical protein
MCNAIRRTREITNIVCSLHTFIFFRSIFEAKWNDDSRYFSRRAAALLVSVS